MSIIQGTKVDYVRWMDDYTHLDRENGKSSSKDLISAKICIV